MRTKPKTYYLFASLDADTSTSSGSTPQNFTKVLEVLGGSKPDQDVLKEWHSLQLKHGNSFRVQCAPWNEDFHDDADKHSEHCRGRVLVRLLLLRGLYILSKWPMSLHKECVFANHRCLANRLSIDSKLRDKLVRPIGVDFGQISLKYATKRPLPKNAAPPSNLEKKANSPLDDNMDGPAVEKQEADEESQRTLKGFAKLIGEFAGLNLTWAGRQYASFFRGIIPHLSHVLRSDPGYAAKFGSVIVFPEAPIKSFFDDVRDALSQSRNRDDILRDRALVIGRLYAVERLGPSRIHLTLTDMGSTPLVFPIEKWERYRKSHSDPLLPAADHKHEQESLVVAIVELGGHELFVEEAAWVSIDQFGTITDVESEHTGLKFLREHGFDCYKPNGDPFWVGNRRVLPDIVAFTADKQPVLLEVDPNNAKRKKRKKYQKFETYVKAGKTSFSWDPNNKTQSLSDVLLILGHQSAAL